MEVLAAEVVLGPNGAPVAPSLGDAGSEQPLDMHSRDTVMASRGAFLTRLKHSSYNTAGQILRLQDPSGPEVCVAKSCAGVYTCISNWVY